MFKLAFLRGYLSPENFEKALRLKTLTRLKNSTPSIEIVETAINPRLNESWITDKYSKIRKKLISALSPAEAYASNVSGKPQYKIFLHKPDSFISLKYIAPFSKGAKSTYEVTTKGRNTIINHEIDEIASRYRNAFVTHRMGHNGADVILHESNRIFHEATDAERKFFKELRDNPNEEVERLKQVGIRYGEEYVAPGSKRWVKAIKNAHNNVYNQNVKIYDDYVKKITDKKPFFMRKEIRDIHIDPERREAFIARNKAKTEPVKDEVFI